MRQPRVRATVKGRVSLSRTGGGKLAWIRVDDHFDEHPKFAKAGPLGMAMWLAGLAYCNRNLTDGFIPWSTAMALLSWSWLGEDVPERGRVVYTVGITSGMSGDDATCKAVAELLVDSGLWEEADGGYLVHDYADYQPSKEEVMAERDRWKERKQRSRDGMSRRDSTRDSTIESHRSHTPPVPVPVPVPVPEKEKEEEENTGTATRSPRAPRFVPPTLEDVQAYCDERRNTVDPEAWMAHYEANGWRVGRNPMKSWKAAVRTWERNGLNPAPEIQPPPKPLRKGGKDPALAKAEQDRLEWEAEQAELERAHAAHG